MSYGRKESTHVEFEHIVRTKSYCSLTLMGAQRRSSEPASRLNVELGLCEHNLPIVHFQSLLGILTQQCACSPPRCLTSFFLPICLPSSRRAIHIAIFSTHPLLLVCMYSILSSCKARFMGPTPNADTRGVLADRNASWDLG